MRMFSSSNKINCECYHWVLQVLQQGVDTWTDVNPLRVLNTLAL